MFSQGDDVCCLITKCTHKPEAAKTHCGLSCHSVVYSPSLFASRLYARFQIPVSKDSICQPLAAKVNDATKEVILNYYYYYYYLSFLYVRVSLNISKITVT